MKYEIKIIDNKIIVYFNEYKECVFCGGKANINTHKKSKINVKKIFYETFNNEVIIDYERRICKCCGKTFSEKCSDIKKYFQTKELKKEIYKTMFEKEVLKYEELEEREIKILQNENINFKKYGILERRKEYVNQFDKKMIKVLLIDLESFETKELKYKEFIKKDYTIKQDKKTK